MKTLPLIFFSPKIETVLNQNMLWNALAVLTRNSFLPADPDINGCQTLLTGRSLSCICKVINPSNGLAFTCPLLELKLMSREPSIAILLSSINLSPNSPCLPPKLLTPLGSHPSEGAKRRLESSGPAPESMFSSQPPLGPVWPRTTAQAIVGQMEGVFWNFLPQQYSLQLISVRKLSPVLCPTFPPVVLPARKGFCPWEEAGVCDLLSA